MNPNVQLFQSWFEHLSDTDKEAVLKHVYKNIYVDKSGYKGPDPSFVPMPSIFLGPAPTTPPVTTPGTSAACPNCGHPLTIKVS
jgi:hypothetical protein